MTTVKQDADFIFNVISPTLLEESIDWIKSNLNPEDVFDKSDLETWAKENGWVEDD